MNAAQVTDGSSYRRCYHHWPVVGLGIMVSQPVNTAGTLLPVCPFCMLGTSETFAQ